MNLTEPTYLAGANAHERDSHVQFDEGPHIYTVDGDSSFTSVTTWNHSHFGHFDADKIIDNMMKGKNWKPGYKYYGMTKDEIKEGWEKNRDEAAAAGTKMHYDIECYYNLMDIKNDSIEFKWFFVIIKKLTLFKIKVTTIFMLYQFSFPNFKSLIC